MVGIGKPARLVDRLLHAVHAGIAAPEEIRQRAMRLKIVHRGIVRHLQPVDAAHKFAPAQNLANEALDRVQRRMAGVPGGFGGAHRLAGKQQPGIQIKADMAVIHPRLVRDHRVLIGAEQRQPLGDECVKDSKRLLPCDGKAEIIEIAEMPGAAFGDEGQHLGGGLVGREGRRLRHGQRQVGRFAIVGVIVPPAADRLAAPSARHDDGASRDRRTPCEAACGPRPSFRTCRAGT